MNGSLRFWREVGWVALYEAGEAARTRLLQLGILAYLGGLGFFNAILIMILREVEGEAARALGVTPTSRPGAMLGQLQAEGKLDDLVSFLAGEQSGEARKLLSEPLLGLWATAGAMVLLPTLLAFSASGTVATEVRSRSIRYLACRTGRLQIVLGKMLGQSGFAALALAVGGGMTWLMGMLLMVKVPPLGLALCLLSRAPRVLAFCFPAIGLGIGASQIGGSPNGGRVMGMGVWFGMPILLAWLSEKAGPDTLGRLADLSLTLIAPSNWWALWSLDPSTAMAAGGRCLVLGLAYFSVGFLFFRRRDL